MPLFVLGIAPFFFFSFFLKSSHEFFFGKARELLQNEQWLIL